MRKIQALCVYVSFADFVAAAKAAGVELYGISHGYEWGASPNLHKETLLQGLWACTGVEHFSACCRAADDLERIANQLLEHSEHNRLLETAQFIRNGREVAVDEVVELRRRLRRALQTIERHAAKAAKSSPTGEG